MATTTDVLKEPGKVAVDGLDAAVQSLGTGLLSYAIALAAIGTIAMGIVEMGKSVFMARKRYNRWRIFVWAGQGAVLQELLLLAIGSHSDPCALYDQPVEKMMGQIQAAATLALEYPAEYPNLYTWLTSVPESYWQGGAHNSTGEDGARWRNSISLVHKIRQGQATTADETQSAHEASAARARLNNLIARKLDAFQNQTQYLWERLNQWGATVVATVIFLIAVYVSNFAPTTPLDWLKVFVLALPAGVVAPFAKQLAGSLASFGK